MAKPISPEALQHAPSSNSRSRRGHSSRSSCKCFVRSVNVICQSKTCFVAMSKAKSLWPNQSDQKTRSTLRAVPREAAEVVRYSAMSKTTPDHSKPYDPYRCRDPHPKEYVHVIPKRPRAVTVREKHKSTAPTSSESPSPTLATAKSEVVRALSDLFRLPGYNTTMLAQRRQQC